MHRISDPDLHTFLQSYPPSIQEAALDYRQLLFLILPDIQEVLDLPARLLGYTYGPGYADTICTLLPSQKGLKMGFFRGAHLPDPHHILHGAGKVHRYVNLDHHLDRKFLIQLLEEAHTAYLAARKK